MASCVGIDGMLVDVGKNAFFLRASASGSSAVELHFTLYTNVLLQALVSLVFSRVTIALFR